MYTLQELQKEAAKETAKAKVAANLAAKALLNAQKAAKVAEAAKQKLKEIKKTGTPLEIAKASAIVKNLASQAQTAKDKAEQAELIAKTAAERAKDAQKRYQDAKRSKSQVGRVMLVDGVFEGGGALGAAYAGALGALDDNNIWFARVAGASAGAITAALIAVGFTAPEIQWLMSSYPGRKEPLPRTLSALGIKEPIGFTDFLDFPKLENIDQATKRKDILWKVLNGTVIDYYGGRSLDIPTRKSIVDQILKKIFGVPYIGPGIAAIPNARKEIKKALEKGLAFLPEKTPHVKDFLAEIDNPAFRRQFADTLWDAIAKNIPSLRAETNLIFEAGLFEGAKFLKIFGELINKKVKGNKNANVQFKDLDIPLAVIAMDLKTKKMRVFSKKTDPDMLVVEAVRCSMSIPVVFQPYKPTTEKNEFVDGGLISNFPAWLFTEGGTKYWAEDEIDHGRPKIGFQLDDTLKGNGGGRTPAQLDKAIYDFFSKKIKDELAITIPSGSPDPITKRLIDEAQYFSTYWAPDLKKLLNTAGTTIIPVSQPEEAVRQRMLEGLMAGMTYYDVLIPLLGFHWLDFSINKNEKELKAMWGRAERATLDALKNGPEPLIS